METKKLFYADVMQRQFTATVLSCEEAKGGFTVVLDQTAFYPDSHILSKYAQHTN